MWSRLHRGSGAIGPSSEKRPSWLALLPPQIPVRVPVAGRLVLPSGGSPPYRPLPLPTACALSLPAGRCALPTAPPENAGDSRHSEQERPVLLDMTRISCVFGERGGWSGAPLRGSSTPPQGLVSELYPQEKAQIRWMLQGSRECRWVLGDFLYVHHPRIPRGVARLL